MYEIYFFNVTIFFINMNFVYPFVNTLVSFLEFLESSPFQLIIPKHLKYFLCVNTIVWMHHMDAY